MNQSNL